MRPLTKNERWGCRGAQRVAVVAIQGQPGFAINFNVLFCGVAGVTPNIKFLAEKINILSHIAYTHVYIGLPRGVTPATRRVKQLFQNSFWGCLSIFLGQPHPLIGATPTNNTLKSLIFPSQQNGAACHD